VASGINFNPASFQTGGGASVNRQPSTRKQGAPEPSDGFQASGAQPSAAAGPTTPAPVHLEVTREQLTSAAFQQTLATLASSGIPVTVGLIASSEATPAAAPQVNVQVTVQPQQSLQTGFGNIAPSQKPSPPTYGGD